MVRIAALLISLAIIAFSLLRFDAYMSFSDLLEQSEQNKKPLNDLDPLLRKKIDNLVNQQFASYSELARLSHIYSGLGESATSPEDRIAYLCKTEQSLNKALKQEPFNARSLVTWASVRQLLQDYRCDGETLSRTGSQAPEWPTAEWEQAINLAIQSAPIDQQALFNAALVSMWGKKKDQAYQIFRKVLELGTDTSVFQREVIYNLVTDADSLNQLIPARIPQIMEFLRYLKANTNQESKQLKESLEKLEVNALEDFSQRYIRKEIDDQLYQQRLSEMWELTRGSKSNLVVDKLLYKFFSDTEAKDLSRFFEMRSNYSELPTLVAYRMADSRPLKSSISDWGSQKRVALDNFFTSMGFYLPKDTTLRRIELHSNSYTPEPIQSLIRVLASDDNQSWEDLTGICTVSSIVFNSKVIVQIELPGSTKPFWKINFQSPARVSKFVGPLDSMIRILGIGG